MKDMASQFFPHKLILSPFTKDGSGMYFRHTLKNMPSHLQKLVFSPKMQLHEHFRQRGNTIFKKCGFQPPPPRNLF